MLSKSQQLLIVVALCASVIRADVDCSKMPKYMDPKYCCPLPNLFPPEVRGKCVEYNFIQTMPTEARSEDRHRPHDSSMLTPCFFLCAFNETGVYKDNEMDMDAFKEYLLETYNSSPDLQSVASEAYTECVEKMNDYKERMPNNRPQSQEVWSRHNCPRKPIFLMGCVLGKMLSNCPASLWNDSEECNERREFFQKCHSYSHGHRRRFGKERAERST